MATTSITLPTDGKILADYEGGAHDYFDIDVGSGSTWTRIASGVAGKTDPYGNVTTTWFCPQRAINTTDSVRVTMTGKDDLDNTIFTLIGTTAALGQPYLQASTWSFTRTVGAYQTYDLEYVTDTIVSNIQYGVADTTLPVLSGTLVATAGDKQATLSGPTASDASGIAKWQYSKDSGAWTDIPSSATTTMPMTTISGLTNGTTYSFRVRALDPAGNPSSASNSVDVIPSATVLVYAYAVLRDLIGTMVARLRLTDTTIDRDNGSTWTPLATGLTLGSLHDIVIDTHLWTISIDGGTPIEFEPLTLPVYPIGELSFEMVDGTKMWFGQIRYY